MSAILSLQLDIYFIYGLDKSTSLRQSCYGLPQQRPHSLSTSCYLGANPGLQYSSSNSSFFFVGASRALILTWLSLTIAWHSALCLCIFEIEFVHLAASQCARGVTPRPQRPCPGEGSSVAKPAPERIPCTHWHCPGAWSKPSYVMPLPLSPGLAGPRLLVGRAAAPFAEPSSARACFVC